MSSASKKGQRLVLLDAHAILHRAYHALPQFSSSRGEPTGALYGLASMLIKIITDLKPDHLAAAYDLPKPTFRHEAYKDYKAGRAKADDALVSQMKRSRDIFEAFGIPIYEKEGFEADDVLGTIVHQLQTANHKLQTNIVIASGDMDTLQLVDGKRVQVYTLRKGIQDAVLYDEEKVRERFGFGPKLLPDYKGLAGDPSDNIKGVAGIGEKTATELIQKFGSIEHIYSLLGEKKGDPLGQKGRPFSEAGIKERAIKLLKDGREDAEFSKILATIRRDAPIEFRLPEKPWRGSVDLGKAEKLFRELEFRTLGERLKATVAANGHEPSVSGGGAGKGGRGRETISPASLYSSKAKREENAGTKKAEGVGEPRASAGQNLFSGANSGAGAEAALAEKETSIALWLIRSNLTNPTREDILRFAGTEDFGAARARIFAELKTLGLTRVFEEIEKPLIPVVQRMNERGVKIDTRYLGTLSEEYHKELSALERDIRKFAGTDFNLNSPKQLGDVLFSRMGLKAARQKKTAGGALSTRESELEKLRDAHPIIGKILEYREFQKLLSTYLDNLPEMVGADGRLRANFVQAGAATGRMASQNPNLQNIPIQTERGRRIRNGFVAENGFALLALDYSQIELRVAAILSGDEKLTHIFKAGEDVHTSVAAYVFRVPRGEVTKAMRRDAKVINFGMLYGMGVTALQQALREGNPAVTRAEAQKFLDDYFTHFHALAAYIEEVKVSAAERGYTETLFGRRRSFEAIRSPIPYIRAAAERQAMNAPFQGTAADIIKLAMVRADEYLRTEKLSDDVRLILQVHDELVYEVKDSLMEKAAPNLRAIMESVLSPKESRGVPILAEARVGKNWGEMEPVRD